MNKDMGKMGQRIGSKTKPLGIIGWPLGHSLSPLMQNAAFAAAGMDYAYLPLPVPPEQLAAAVAGMKALGFAGVNVTIPHKVEIQKYLDHIEDSAREAGAVNTVVFRDGQAIGHNTDAGGFIASLPESLQQLAGKTAVLLGAGGAARAVVAGLLGRGCERLTVVARNREQGRELVEPFGTRANIVVCGWDDSVLKCRLDECNLLINSTPLGMAPQVDAMPPLDWDNLSAAAVVCDLVYNPLVTRFLACAQERGHQVVTGDGMLLEQGILAYQLWTGQEAPRRVMREVLTKALRDA